MLPKENRIKELLRQNGLDGAIVSSPENFHYVTGFAGHQHTTGRAIGYTIAVVSAREDVPTQLTTMDFEIPTFEKKNPNGQFIIRKYDTWVGVKTWDEIAHGAIVPPPEIMENSMDVLKKMVKEMDLANKKVGLELDFVPLTYYNSLCQAFPEAKWENISDMFIYARSVKTPEEVQMFRDLCRVADEGFTAVSKIAKIGVSEQELNAAFRESVIASGIAVPSAWSMFSCGESGCRLTLPENAVAKPGDVIKFDAGVNAEYNFYTTDTSRSWVMDGADPALYKLKDRLYEAQRKMIAEAKPGMVISDLYHVAYDYVKEMYPSYRRGHQGHSISMGPQTHEAPYISPTTTRKLEANMVMAFETPCYIENCQGFNIEDMILITETGCEVLTPNTPHYL